MLLKKFKSLTKNKHNLPDDDINVVSLLDILTTLLFFILLITSFTKLGKLSSSFLKSSAHPSDKPVFTLQVKMQDERNALLWLGPIDQLKVMNKADLKDYLKESSKGSDKKGYLSKIKGQDYQDLLQKIQQHLIVIKKSFPHEHKIVLGFHDQYKYQNVIDSMNKMRSLGDQEEAFEITNLINKTEKTKVLFPQIVLSENNR